MFYAFSMVMICSLFCWLTYAWLISVNLGLFITFRVNCLHGFLSLFRLFLLYGTPAVLAFTFI